MSLLSAGMLAELERSNPNRRRSLKIEWPDGTILYSDVALCSINLGFHEPLVKSWGVISDSGSDRSDNAIVPKWTGLQIIDTDGELEAKARRYDLFGTPVTLILCSKNVPDPADWLTRFVGIIQDVRTDEEGLLDLVCGPDDRALRSPFPRPRLSQADFPNLPKGSEQLYVPISPYGRHDSFGLGNIDGQIQPVYVGEYTENDLNDNPVTGSKYVIGLWPIAEILHAYADDVRLAQTTWEDQAIQETVNGRTYSRIMFTTNRSAQKITLDVRGIEDAGDSTGTMIEDPVRQGFHLAANLFFDEVLDPTDGYNTMDDAGTPEINWTYESETTDYIDIRLPAGVRGGRYIPASEEQQIPMDVINESCQSYHYKLFWSYAGKLCARPDNLDHVGYLDSPWIRRPYHELKSKPLTPVIDSQGTIGRMTIEGAYGEALGQFQQKLLVVSQRAPERAGSDTIQGIWLQALI